MTENITILDVSILCMPAGPNLHKEQVTFLKCKVAPSNAFLKRQGRLIWSLETNWDALEKLLKEIIMDLLL